MLPQVGPALYPKEMTEGILSSEPLIKLSKGLLRRFTDYPEDNPCNPLNRVIHQIRVKQFVQPACRRLVRVNN
jgi:hypothetical protein